MSPAAHSTTAALDTPSGTGTRRRREATGGAVPYPAFDGTQACVDADQAALDAFVGQPGRDPASAKQLCFQCRFLAPCRAWALSNDASGVWGGLDDEQRSDWRQRAGLPEPRSVGDELDAMVLAARRSAARSADQRLSA